MKTSFQFESCETKGEQRAYSTKEMLSEMEISKDETLGTAVEFDPSYVTSQANGLGDLRVDEYFRPVEIKEEVQRAWDIVTDSEGYHIFIGSNGSLKTSNPDKKKRFEDLNLTGTSLAIFESKESLASLEEGTERSTFAKEICTRSGK